MLGVLDRLTPDWARVASPKNVTGFSESGVTPGFDVRGMRDVHCPGGGGCKSVEILLLPHHHCECFPPWLPERSPSMRFQNIKWKIFYGKIGRRAGAEVLGSHSVVLNSPHICLFERIIASRKTPTDELPRIPPL